MSYRGTSALAVVGLGHSRVFRRDDVPLAVLAKEACENAIDDAGLTAADIDGIVSQPDSASGAEETLDGIELVSPDLMERMLGLDVAYMDRTPRVIIHGFVSAANAVAAGTCDYALVFKAMHSPSGKYGAIAPTVAPGESQFSAPYGLEAVAAFALLAQRYLATSDGTREDLAVLAVQNRANGLLWEHGYWAQHNPQPLTVEQYLAGRMICDPLSLYDCDIPIQACGAFVITTAERARDCRHRPAYIKGMANDLDAPLNHLTLGLEGSMERAAALGRHLWRNSGLGPSDVDVANLYDGFSIHTPLWLEALGLSEPGQGLSMIGAGETAPAGRLPINTSGGNQGAGRLHGIPHLMESVLQVTGRAGPRQIDGAEVAVTTVGGMASAGGVVFSSSP